MKNIAYSFIMIILFGSLFPSAQAYANGKKYIQFNKIQNKTILNDDLVDKLVNSKNFEAYCYSFFILGTLTFNNLSSKTEKQLKETISKLENSKNGNDIKLSYENDILGFKINKEASEKLNELSKKFRSEFSELAFLTKEQVENVVAKALVKGDMINKFIAFADSESCAVDALNNHTKCIADAKWFKVAAGACTVVGVIAIIVCGVALSAVSAGTAAPAWLSFAAATSASITTVCLTAFSYSWSSTIQSNCANIRDSDLKYCAFVYGSPAVGGAE